MTRPRIVFLDAATYGDISLQRFTDRWDCQIHQTTKPAEVIRRLAGHAVVVTNKVAIDAAALAAPETQQLSLIAVAATGTDVIDRMAARARGIRICNVPGYAADSVAQFTLALILELATSAARYGRAVKAGEWHKSPVFTLLAYPSVELRGKKLGIIGHGNIGRMVAQMARSFGMEVSIAARPGSAEPPAPGRVALEELLQECDFISLHCPLTPQTTRIINERTLGLMKPSAFLINTARGALVDEAALIRSLRQGRLAGAALDVISQEPPQLNQPMVAAARELDNLLVTPHTAWSAREARTRLLAEVAQNIAAFLEGKARNLVTA